MSNDKYHPTKLEQIKNKYYFGVDVSQWQGHIKWDRVATEVDFAIIRAGYGKGNVDKEAVKNVHGCMKYGIPYGLYWFSYAKSEQEAVDEGKHIKEFIGKYCTVKPKMIAFDFEYDSISNMEKHGVTPTMELVQGIARAFIGETKELNTYLYVNPDFMNRYFNGITNKLWLAQWPSNPDEIDAIPFGYDIWQYSSNGSVLGINTRVDVNLSQKGVWTVDKMWYDDTMQWAVGKGIMDGTRPDEPCTRAETAQMMRNLFSYIKDVFNDELEGKDQ